MIANMNVYSSAACPACSTPRTTSCAATNGGSVRSVLSPSRAAPLSLSFSFALDPFSRFAALICSLRSQT
jgi:hypothetical protein